MRYSPLKAKVIIIEPNGFNSNRKETEGVQIIRSVPNTIEPPTSVLVNQLLNGYGDKPNYNTPTYEEANLLRTAFPKIAEQLLPPNYDGSKLVTDTKQDLLGEHYLSQQIKRVNEENKKRSIVDTYNYMLYKGDRSAYPKHTQYTPISGEDLRRVKPVKTTYHKLSDLLAS